MTSKTTLGDRIKARRMELRISQEKLAKLAGLKQPTISSLETNEASTTRNIASIANALKVNALWLETGLGNPVASSKAHAVIKASDVDQRTEHLQHEVTIVESRGSCGGGAINKPDVHELTKRLNPILKDEAFFTNLGVDPSDVSAVIADGDSMANFIVHGDTVFVSTRPSDQLDYGLIYALQTPSGITFKRIIERTDGSVVLASDNSNKVRYPDEHYSAEEARDLMIFGKYLYRQG